MKTVLTEYDKNKQDLKELQNWKIILKYTSLK